MEFQYKCRTFTLSTGDTVHFVRVQDVIEVVTQLINELRKAGHMQYLDNLPKDSLGLHVAADKGRNSTKLILRVINQDNCHSIENAELIGYFDSAQIIILNQHRCIARQRGLDKY